MQEPVVLCSYGYFGVCTSVGLLHLWLVPPVHADSNLSVWLARSVAFGLRDGRTAVAALWFGATGLRRPDFLQVPAYFVLMQDLPEIYLVSSARTEPMSSCSSRSRQWSCPKRRLYFRSTLTGHPVPRWRSSQ